MTKFIDITVTYLVTPKAAAKQQTGLCDLYYKNILAIISEACTISVLLALVLALASVINYDRK